MSKPGKPKSASAPGARDAADPGLASDGPIAAVERDVLIGRALAPFPHVLLAVSGGADSTAMMLLAAGWWQSVGRPSPCLRVATVDHRLRSGSSAEAVQVARAAARIGLAHSTLEWTGPRPASGVQAAARAARYELLLEHARSVFGGCAGAFAIAVAHTRDDQAETLLMRLARGSGVDGLAGMAASRPLGDPVEGGAVALVRPLLQVPKSRLVATLRAADLGWIEDPSNEVEAFERVRLRHAGAALAAAGLDSAHVALSASRLGRARAALEAAADDLEQVAVDMSGGAFASIDKGRLQAAPEEIRLRVLLRVLHAFGGQLEPPPLAAGEALLHRLAVGQRAATLAGCLVEQNGCAIRVYREPGRRGLPRAALEPDKKLLWDNRFLVSAGADVRCATMVRALSEVETTRLKQQGRLPASLPRRAALTLPTAWQGEDLVAIGGLQPSTETQHGRQPVTFRFLAGPRSRAT